MSRQPFRGQRRKLVLALDVGTTYSGISYAVLDPGQVPEIKPVTRFPAHEFISGASKIPTVIWYDRSGQLKAAGAEAMREGVYEMAEDEGWVKAEWFKLHLRPRSQSSPNISAEIPPLPPGKTVVQVFADFLRYLRDCATFYIQDTHANGAELWESVKGDVDYVLSHPNGWEGAQQEMMRRAAALAGLIPNTPEGHGRVSFVTEGEASLHFSIQNGLPAGAMTNGDGVVVVDAGGGTIDFSAYGRSNSQTGAFEEISPPQCHFHGSIFVSIHARLFLENFLAESNFFDDLEHIIRCFDKTTKLRFRNIDDPQYIKFGSTRDTEPEFNIRFGQLKLQGTDVAGFFEPSVQCVVNAVHEQRKLAHRPISHVVLVGGFAASDWLYFKVRDTLKPQGFNVVRPENHVNKAVSDGAISFYLDHYVDKRVAKMTYGNFCHIPYNDHDPEHKRRHHTTFMSMAANFSTLCTIEADLSRLTLRPLSNGQLKYYRLDYAIVLLFGATELKAMVAWTENGVERRSPAKIVYNHV
ncbi:hypothetical protein CC1G_14089 [Coprinopsis cinerea okayama7|uniref:Uncharacterized protein n=1 Tax=Coprinopsis cinerea (strain Okayama-7 / 130 / ATCC MYA-4618 / FGSC 9003) TaxID=240176 RepID=D6RLA7_COPC7|nr:hypothetical protein CC1G_14089 [Coprinopsis cinerea okayama7\|eukprot:XP_002911557.1 hypothetical protein CC1G_14089 [Coprinopsis cinerea okayama7\